MKYSAVFGILTIAWSAPASLESTTRVAEHRRGDRLSMTTRRLANAQPVEEFPITEEYLS
jgi:hypothetical protein